jgi:hypothetical protein
MSTSKSGSAFAYRPEGPITISWNDFRRAHLPDSASREQREHMTSAFYTGALTCLERIRQLTDRRSVKVTEDLRAILDELEQEALTEADAAAVGVAQKRQQF